MLYGWIISLYLTQALQGQFSSPELCHFFTLYTNKGVKGCLLSLLSLKCASNEHRGSIRSTQDFLFPPSDLGCRGNTSRLPGGGDTFLPIPSPNISTPKTNYHRELVGDLQDYPFLLWGQAPGSLRANLAHPSFNTFFNLFTKIGAKGRLLSPLSLKYASNEHQGSIKGTWDIFSRPPIWAVGVPVSGLLRVGTLFNLSYLRNFRPQIQCAKFG